MSRMEEGERRKIEDELVEKMDVTLRPKKSRELYGKKGRKVEDLEPYQGCEEGEWEEVEEEEKEERQRPSYARKLICELQIPSRSYHLSLRSD